MNLVYPTGSDPHRFVGRFDGYVRSMNASEQQDEGAWRDERKLPLKDLTAAVATSPGDGQSDDPTGNDAGIEASPADIEASPADEAGDPDASSAAGRALRTDFTGRTGPN
jgi:hypothetical protein